MVDCDDLDAGCNGGLPDNAVKFIEKEGGLEFETDYPYTAHRSRACNYNSSLSRVQVSGVIDFQKGDDTVVHILKSYKLSIFGYLVNSSTVSYIPLQSFKTASFKTKYNLLQKVKPLVRYRQIDRILM